MGFKINLNYQGVMVRKVIPVWCRGTNLVAVLKQGDFFKSRQSIIKGQNKKELINIIRKPNPS